MNEELKIDLLTLNKGIRETNKELEKIKDMSSAILVDMLYKVQKMIIDYITFKMLIDDEEEQINPRGINNDKQKQNA